MTGESPSKLSRAYLEALEGQAGDDEYEAAKERHDALQERLERFESRYGESDPATEELRQKVQSVGAELAEIEENRQQPKELEKELLEAATQFMLNDEWLQPKVLTALNRVLIGKSHPTLRVRDVELAGPDDAEELDDIGRYDAIDIVRKIVMDKLGESDDLKRVWGSIEGTTKEGPFRVVAEKGGADPDDVVEAMEEDIDRDAARGRLKNAVYQLEISPYHREDGRYELSTAGRYIAAEYARVEETEDDDTFREGDGSNDSSGGDGQMTLGEGSAEVQGGSGR